ncbi:hypothetical protein R5R35_004679 [Gryllus longicercus]|uniref:ISXO2-like transposase domain-containing protein n=1 Tax=Gryllus longicercus TaxID=2509291 RepID=A0AAN9ZA43_9ORTH
MNWVSLVNIVKNEERCLQWCRQQRLVPNNVLCPYCGALLTAAGNRGKGFGDFLCTRRNHQRFKAPATRGTILDNVKVTVGQALQIMYCFSHNYTYEDTVHECSQGKTLSKRTVAERFSYLRDVCMDAMDRRYIGAPRIGGPNSVLEIDECKIGRRKYNRGRVVEGNRVLGVIDRDTKEVRLEICPGNLTDANTLLSMIQRHVQPQTTIITDLWRDYEDLKQQNSDHLAANHSMNFVDPTNNTESQWRPLSRRLSRGGLRQDNLDSHLVEYLWRKDCKRLGRDPFLFLIEHCTIAYPEELKPSASFFLEPMKVVKQEILEDYEEELDPPTTMHLEPEEVKEEIVEVYEEFESTSTLNIEPEETIKEEIAEGEEEFEHSATLYIEPEETVKEEIAEWDVEVKDFEYISVGACDLATTNNENEDVSDDGSLLGDWYSYAEATPNNRNCKTTPRSKNKTEKHIGSITTAIKELKDLEKSLSASPLTIRTTVIEDECEIMGKWIASQLRKLPKHSRHRANLEIQQVIKKHSVEHMNSSSSVLSASLSNDHTYSILKPFNS